VTREAEGYAAMRLLRSLKWSRYRYRDGTISDVTYQEKVL